MVRTRDTHIHDTTIVSKVRVCVEFATLGLTAKFFEEEDSSRQTGVLPGFTDEAQGIL